MGLIKKLSFFFSSLICCISSADARIDVTDPIYGANGGDLFDDTTAIQNAIDAAYTQQAISGANWGNERLEKSFGNTVYIPSGVYYISDTLYLPLGIAIEGETSTSTILFFEIGSKDAIVLTGDPSNKIYPSASSNADRRFGNSISSLRLQSRITNSTFQSNHLIYSSDNTWWLSVDDVFLFGSAAAAIELTNVIHVNITNSEIESRGGECIKLLGGTTVNIDRCYLHRSGPGHHIVHSAGLHSLRISNSVIESAGIGGSTEAHGIFLNDNVGVLISGNHFEANPYWDIYTTSDEPTETSSTTTILGNYFNSTKHKKPFADIPTVKGEYGIAFLERGRHSFLSNLIAHVDSAIIFIQEQDAFDSLLLQSNTRRIDLILLDQNRETIDLKYEAKNIMVDVIGNNAMYLGGTNTAYGRALHLKGSQSDNTLLKLNNNNAGSSSFKSRIDFNFGKNERSNLTQIIAVGRSDTPGNERGWGELNTMVRGTRKPVIKWQDVHNGDINVGLGGIENPKSKLHIPDDTIINLGTSPVATLENESMTFYHDKVNKQLKLAFKDDAGTTHEITLGTYSNDSTVPGAPTNLEITP